MSDFYKHAPLWHQMNMNGISQTEIAKDYGTTPKRVCIILKSYRFHNNLKGPTKDSFSRHMDRPETIQNTLEWRAKTEKKWDEKLQLWVTVCPKAYSNGYGLDQSIKPRPHRKSFKDYTAVTQ